MEFRQFKTEKGVTLIELLAVLSLVAIVIVLSSTVISQVFKGQEKANENISLNQYTNVLITELRNDYQKKSNNSNYGDRFHLCFSGIEGLEIEELIINGEILEISNGCTTQDIANQETLHVELKTKLDSTETLSLKTTWNNKQDHPLVVTLVEDEEDWEEGEITNCEPKGTFKNLHLKGENCKRYTVTETLIARNLVIVDEDVTLHIQGASVNFIRGIKLSNGAKIVISGNSEFSDKNSGIVYCVDRPITDLQGVRDTIHCRL